MDDFFGGIICVLCLCALYAVIKYWYIALFIIAICVIANKANSLAKEREQKENKLKQDIEKTLRIYFSEDERDYTKINNYLLDCWKTGLFSLSYTQNLLNNHYDKIASDIEYYYKHNNFEEIKNIEMFVSKYCIPLHNKYNKLFQIILQIKELSEPEKLILYNPRTDSIDTTIVDKFINKKFTTLELSVQENLWYETLRKDFCQYSYEIVRDSIYKNISNKDSMILALSEEFVINIQKGKIDRKINISKILDQDNENNKKIYQKTMSWINSLNSVR